MGISKKEFEELKEEVKALEEKVSHLHDRVITLTEKNVELTSKFEEAILAIQKEAEEEKKVKEAMDEYLKPVI